MRPTNLPKPVRVGGLALAALVLVGAGVFYTLDDDTDQAPRVELVSARRGTVTAAVSAAGNTVDDESRDLAFGGPGTVRKVYVKAGDKVGKGKVLASIGSAPARERYTAAKAQLAAAQEALDEAEERAASPSSPSASPSPGRGESQQVETQDGSRTRTGDGTNPTPDGRGECERPTTAPTGPVRVTPTPAPSGTATPTETPGQGRTPAPDLTLVPGGTSTPTGPDRLGAVRPAGGAVFTGHLVKRTPTPVPTSAPARTPTATATATAGTRHGTGSGAESPRPAPTVTVTVTATATVTVTATPTTGASSANPTRGPSDPGPGQTAEPSRTPKPGSSARPTAPPKPTTKPTVRPSTGGEPTARPSTGAKPTPGESQGPRPTPCTGQNTGQGTKQTTKQTTGQNTKQGTGQQTAQGNGQDTGQGAEQATGQNTGRGATQTSQQVTNRGTGQNGGAGNGQGAPGVEQAEAGVKRAQADLTDARQQLAGVRIVAPADGTVMSVSGAVGDSVGTGAFVTLGDLDELQVEALFTESDIGSLKAGQRAAITLATREGQKYAGTVTRIAPTATTTGQLVRYGVTIAFDKAPDDLMVGQTASVTVTVAEAQEAVYLPVQAVRTKDGTSRVTVQNGGERVVRTGVRGDRYVEITSGLAENDRVVLPGGAATGGFPDSGWPGGVSNTP